MRKNVCKCICIFAALFTVFFCNVCYKLFQDVVILLPLCIIPAILECEKLSACDKMNFFYSLFCLFHANMLLPSAFQGSILIIQQVF